MKRLALIFVTLAGFGIILALAACSQGGSQPTTQTPDKASPASVVKGAQIYDMWWKVVEGAAEPTGNQSLWATQTTNARQGADTWRCKECHGWDYKGKDGGYGKGSHFTGFPGVYDASLNKSKAQIVDTLSGKTNASHNFATSLGEAGVSDVANFIKEGVVDESKYIDAAKKAIGANVAHGQELYTSTCTGCHGADGKLILFDGKNSLGFLANDNPWEVFHKIRFGQPGTPMPAGVTNGWSIQDSVDVLGYTQTLP